jgi:tRNA nucleotidyltransferase (CCA-adding enzyme)
MVRESQDGYLKMDIDRTELKEVIEGDAALAKVRAVAGDLPCYLVGGTVRDALLGHEPLDLDLAVEGPVAEFALNLDPEAVLHERFDTAELDVEGRRVDLARTRSERYPRPGSLPLVEPAGIEEDLSRRDFTINALAAPLERPGVLLDPCGGLADLERRVINVIHPKSFTDDPTRALRAARYAARLGFDVDHRTADLLPSVDLETVSRERFESELKLSAAEPTAMEALRLASAWRLLDLDGEDLALLAHAYELLEADVWGGWCSRADLLLAIAGRGGVFEPGGAIGYPGTPSLANALASRIPPVELLLARAAGSDWLDQWVSDWRTVSPLVTGDDLLAAGVPRGEAVGVGLDAALAAALDDGVSSREEQLDVALAAARSRQGPENA